MQQGRIVIITGSPGTGKSTVLVKLLWNRIWKSPFVSEQMISFTISRRGQFLRIYRSQTHKMER